MNWPSTTTIIRTFLSADYPGLSNESAMTRGRGVHAACHLIAAKDEDREWESRHPECQPYLDAYRAFLREHSFRLISAEKEFRSEAHRFVTHPDEIGELDEFGTVDLEIKSGTMPRWCRLQTAGQILAIGVPSMKRFGLLLRADASYQLYPHEDFRDIDRFRSMIDTWWVIQEFRNGEPSRNG